MNKHIKLIKKYLADNDSVTPEQLQNSRASADAAADAAYAAAEAAAYADTAASYTRHRDARAEALYYAADWVKRYEELSNK